MIVVQTPLRISFLGGGTDFEDFYREHDGAVLSTAIDKCVFVIVKERFDNLIYVNYSQKEITKTPDEIKHNLVREAMKMTGVQNGIEITNLADIPTEGTGLGSSSSFTVALLHALYAYKGETRTAEDIAAQACRIEIDQLGSPIGKQDQYMAAYGGFRFITFNSHGIKLESISISQSSRRKLDGNLLLFYTGIARKSGQILSEQKANIQDRLQVLTTMKDLAYNARDALMQSEIDSLGEMMHRGWELKKQMASTISNDTINAMYETALRAGALGGKVTGAGGGGFLLLYCPPAKQENLRSAFHGVRELPFHFERDGSKVIFNYRRVP